MGIPIPRFPTEFKSPVSQEMTPHEYALSLIAQRDEIEKEIREQQAILASEKTTFSTPLVDAEGFPRADIDVYSIRLARVRIIELTNDSKDLTEKIAKAIEVVHSAQREEEASKESSSAQSDETPATNLSDLQPFVRVDGVAPGSPASEAGLLREDHILKFGTLTAASFTARSLQPLASYVSSHENVCAHIETLMELGLMGHIISKQSRSWYEEHLKL
ncbi:putative 26S proteasome regulatory subunit [Tulasnella sp. 418]|nr:putative 26S proteasome regulatory subunit [Tulasnella sp. 418]